MGRWLRRIPVFAGFAVSAVAALSVGRMPVGAQQDLVARGRDLYMVGCVSCHGTDGKGTVAPNGERRGTDLTNAGEAGAYYMLSTGRMPLNNPDDQPVHREPAYGDDDIDALVAYVASLGKGPRLPRVETSNGDLQEGGEIFRANCQACHSASGSGGALSYGRAAPPLSKATSEQVGAAIRSGPGQMPVFGPEEITDEQLNGLAAYVEYLRRPEDPGGLPLGRIGPVPEGFVAWGVGVPLLLAAVWWIGSRSPARARRSR
ncbi:MAG: c-type cytochrome [Acidimicrobiales bacterium]|nr:c-type cytochrome [Acidimicrobiales bacterium]